MINEIGEDKSDKSITAARVERFVSETTSLVHTNLYTSTIIHVNPIYYAVAFVDEKQVETWHIKFRCIKHQLTSQTCKR